MSLTKKKNCLTTSSGPTCAPAVFRAHPVAFTLIELLLVVALITLLAGASGAYYLGSYRRSLVRKSARQLMLTAKYARTIALERQKPCYLILDQKENAFFLTIDQLNEETGMVEQIVIENQYHKPVKLPPGVTFENISIRPTLYDSSAFGDEYESDQDKITFVANGSADAAAVLITDKKNYFTVFIAAATGKPKLKIGKFDEIAPDTIDLDQ